MTKPALEAIGEISFSFEDRAKEVLAKFRRTQVFISHSHSDKLAARRLARFLEREGFEAWLDEAEIRVVDSLIGKIQAGIGCADYLLALLSKRSVASNWVQKELEQALSLEIEGRRIKILPLLLEDCELPGFLKGKRYADFRSGVDKRHSKKLLLEAMEPID